MRNLLVLALLNHESAAGTNHGAIQTEESSETSHSVIECPGYRQG